MITQIGNYPPKTLKPRCQSKISGGRCQSKYKCRNILVRYLRPQDIAAIASTGINEIQVYRNLRVGVLSTGNEIIRPGSFHKTGANL